MRTFSRVSYTTLLWTVSLTRSCPPSYLGPSASGTPCLDDRRDSTPTGAPPGRTDPERPGPEAGTRGSLCPTPGLALRISPAAPIPSFPPPRTVFGTEALTLTPYPCIWNFPRVALESPEGLSEESDASHPKSLKVFSDYLCHRFTSPVRLPLPRPLLPHACPTRPPVLLKHSGSRGLLRTPSTRLNASLPLDRQGPRPSPPPPSVSPTSGREVTCGLPSVLRGYPVGLVGLSRRDDTFPFSGKYPPCTHRILEC